MKPFLFIFSRLAVFAVFGASSAYALTFEQWNNLPLNPSVLTLQKEGIAERMPDTSVSLTNPTLSNLAAGTGVRLRGSITPIVSGQYSFAISGSRNATLWISPDSSRFTKSPIAWFHDPTSIQQWNKFTSQQSTPIQLVAGTAY